ncbi:MAG: Small-conductance mechanosensitive channel MscMJ [Candidatus Woesearchaeota archaeon]|nr:Small-conductance mechanosensitive channel MscMJ [Candidatus Woesearchaeota archaeon]
MVVGWLAKTYYNNTVKEWLYALLIIFGVAIIAKIFYKIIGSILKRLTSKTKSKIDDIFIDMLEEPLVFALILGGAWFGLNTLVLSDAIKALLVKAFHFLIAIDIAWLLARLFEAIYEEYIVPFAKNTDTELDDQILPLIRKGVKSIIWALGIVIALNNAGYNVGAILAGLGIGGIALAMAAKDTISNIFGGIAIFTDQLFLIGDRIKISGIDGVVEEIRLRSTKVRTMQGRLTTIPNSEFISAAVENVSSEPSRKVKVTLGVSCDLSKKKMQKAMKIVNDLLEKNKNVVKHSVAFNGFGDFTFDIFVIYYIKKGAGVLDTKTQVNLEILNQFNKHKIDMPYPTQVVRKA